MDGPFSSTECFNSTQGLCHLQTATVSHTRPNPPTKPLYSITLSPQKSSRTVQVPSHSKRARLRPAPWYLHLCPPRNTTFLPPPHPAAAPRCVLDGPQGPQADHALRRALRHLLSQTSAGAGRVGASSSPFHLTRGATGPKRANREGPEKAERHQKKSIDSFLAKMAGEERKLLESMRSCGFSVQDVLHAYWVPPVHAGFSLQTWTLGY